jgi:hypothetical protein
MVALSNYDVISGFKRSLSTEIYILSLCMIVRMRITFEWCMLNKKCVLITNGKHGRSLNSDVISSLIRLLAYITRTR